MLLLPGEEVGFTWQLGPVKPLTHWHAQLFAATVPTTNPPFWHSSPLEAWVHCTAVSQLLPVNPDPHWQLQLPIAPEGDPLCWHSFPFAPVVHSFVV